MSQEKLSRLSEKKIRQLATQQSFARGVQYYQNGAIVNPMLQESRLWADCEGSELYETFVTLAQDGIAAASCSCPYDWGGLCKHQVALLLTYVHQPEAFHVVQPIPEMLASRSWEDLIALIAKMVQRHPDLLSLIELSSAEKPNHSNQKLLDVSVYRRQAQRALRRHDMEEIAEDLQEVCNTAHYFFREGEWLNAGALYQMLLEEILESYDDQLNEIDYDGDVAVVSQECAEGIGNCLAEAQELNLTLRELWLTTLIEAILKDIELGGIDFAAGASDALIEYATNDEWTWIEKRLRDEIQLSDDWKRECLVNVLTERYNQTGQSDQGKALLHELGSPEQRAFLLVEEGKIDAAVELAQQHFGDAPGLWEQFANSLVKVNAHERAAGLITALNAKRTHWGYQEWLAKYHIENSDSQTALDWQQQLFLSSPSVEKYKTLKKIAQKLEIWDERRVKVLKLLESKNQIEVLIDIALHEKNIERALELLPKVGNYNRLSYQLSVAKSAEKTHPQASITLYKEMALQAISGRTRKSYQTAAQYLRQVKTLYESLKIESEWKDYIQSLRSQYANLPALRDELMKANL